MPHSLRTLPSVTIYWFLIFGRIDITKHTMCTIIKKFKIWSNYFILLNWQRQFEKHRRHECPTSRYVTGERRHPISFQTDSANCLGTTTTTTSTTKLSTWVRNSNLEYLLQVDQVLTKQQVEFFEALTGFETANKYKVKHRIKKKHLLATCTVKLHLNFS